MKSPSEFQGIFLHREPIDMRKAINGLCEVVFSAQMGELMGPNLFVFSGKRRHSIKVLYFDQSGFCLWQKRLEKARFAWPKKPTDMSVKLRAEPFKWLLEGYDVWKMKPLDNISTRNWTSSINHFSCITNSEKNITNYHNCFILFQLLHFLSLRRSGGKK